MILVNINKVKPKLNENKKLQMHFSVTKEQKKDKDFINFIKKQIESYGIR